MPHRAPAADTTISALKSARSVVAGKMPGPGRVNAIGKGGTARRAIGADLTAGISLTEMPIGDREGRVDHDFAHFVFADDDLGPSAVERIGA